MSFPTSRVHKRAFVAAAVSAALAVGVVVPTLSFTAATAHAFSEGSSTPDSSATTSSTSDRNKAVSADEYTRVLRNRLDTFFLQGKEYKKPARFMIRTSTSPNQKIIWRQWGNVSGSWRELQTWTEGSASGFGERICIRQKNGEVKCWTRSHKEGWRLSSTPLKPEETAKFFEKFSALWGERNGTYYIKNNTFTKLVPPKNFTAITTVGFPAVNLKSTWGKDPSKGTVLTGKIEYLDKPVQINKP